MKTTHIIDFRSGEVYEINDYPLLGVCTGRDSNGNWVILPRSYVTRMEEDNMQRAHDFLVKHCHELNIVITKKKTTWKK